MASPTVKTISPQVDKRVEEKEQSNESSNEAEVESSVLPVLAGFERKISRKSSAYLMKNISGVKELNSYDEIMKAEGFLISEEVVGTNCIGKVYKASQQMYGKESVQLAAKEIDYRKVNPCIEEHLRRFGYKILRFVNKHPFKGLVQVYDLIEIVPMNTAYIIEEMCVQNLPMIIEDEGPFNNVSVKATAHLLAEAINYLHNNGIAHQNIAPENVFRTMNRVIKLGTLEFSTIYWNPETEKPIMQKRGKERCDSKFLAPEVRKGCAYNPAKADVFSFGALIYYMLVRKNPFDGETNENVIKILEEEFKTAIKSDAGVEFVHECTAQNPESRIRMHQAVKHHWFTGIPKSAPFLL
ncbi:cAMP-dependent protein kinase catalytic subunit-like protein [Dinothrombium tinctorium]|uniref:cAMP-dependent protein kinase catalytic subunit-like protein n=1 Tax=Dinothrombium tinctorium TaxID=1965070 RepID=A0A3S3P6C0_9ACAR|nr:cAMP-dependent protein kinase catalytic subunit-like protein [Dinothrombium tinctorium]